MKIKKDHKEELAKLIGAVIYQVQHKDRASGRKVELYRLNQAIRSMRSLRVIPQAVVIISAKDVISLSKEITALRDKQDLAGITSTVIGQLFLCGVPVAILENARHHIMETSEPEHSPLGFRSKRVIALEKENERQRKEFIRELLRQQAWLERQLKRFGYRPKEKRS